MRDVISICRSLFHNLLKALQSSGGTFLNLHDSPLHELWERLVSCHILSSLPNPLRATRSGLEVVTGVHQESS